MSLHERGSPADKFFVDDAPLYATRTHWRASQVMQEASSGGAPLTHLQGSVVGVTDKSRTSSIPDSDHAAGDVSDYSLTNCVYAGGVHLVVPSGVKPEAINYGVT